MGLFGGFKGKLIGKPKKNKTEKDGSNHVVCVKFNTFSEFEPGPSTSTFNGNLGRNDVVKERTRPTKPEIKGFFEQRANGDLGSSSKPTTDPTKTTTPAVETTTIATPPANPPKNVAPPPGPSANATRRTQPPPTAPRTTPAPKATKSQAPKVPTPTPEVVYTKTEDTAKPEPVQATPANSVSTKTIQFPLESSDDDDDDDDDGNFQIHFAQNFGGSSDEDTVSEGEGGEVSPIIFSSQATSIFFGGGEEPKIMRPRKVVVEDDGDYSDGSSASA